MGSKRWMLSNGLGELLLDKTRKVKRFHDLFSGSGAVAQFVATRVPATVAASDLQLFAVTLSEAVLLRNTQLPWPDIWDAWRTRALRRMKAIAIPAKQGTAKQYVMASRKWAAEQVELPITAAYGGHYFSPEQAVWIDCLRVTVPNSRVERAVALAAMIQAASRCAAAPGHTAQPFQPTATALPFLMDAWSRSVEQETRRFLQELAQCHARRIGMATQCDAVTALDKARKGELAFVDPPYSGVHYSRFYHVLETIAVGGCGEVSGVGRYPASSHRPRSDYSVKSLAAAAITKLFETAAKNQVRLIVTFPDHLCSNGLSGETLRDIAKANFLVKEKLVESRFSTLGGTSSGTGLAGSRAARMKAQELILQLDPI